MSALRNRLLAAMEPKQIFHATVWGNPRSMSEALKDIRRTLGGSDDRSPSEDVLQASLLRFEKSQQVASFAELKYVCYGVTVPVGDEKWRLIDRGPLFRKLLKLVDTRSPQPKQYRRCYQGLLNGYFGFAHPPEEARPAIANWKYLREFLSDRLPPMLQQTKKRGETPEWLRALGLHRNLLTADACTKYAESLRLGKTAELKKVCAALGIPSTSWVWDEALMAYVRVVCESDDQKFRIALPGVLNLVNGRAELKLAQILAIRATAMSVVRYSNCVEPQEHTDLRDTSIQWIGNPWISRTA